MLAVSEYLIATVGTQVRATPVRTDFASYWLAGDLARSTVSPYRAERLAARGRQRGLDHDAYPFLYPPAFALMMQPLARLSFERARSVWMVLQSALLLAAIAGTARLVVRSATSLGVRAKPAVGVLLAAFVPAALNSSSVHNDVRSGSVGASLYALFVVMAWGLATRRTTWAALACATAATVKLFPVALVPYVAWRGGRRAGLVALIAVLIGVLCACLHWGAGVLRSYALDALLPVLREPNVWPHNTSLDALIGRILVGNDEIEPLRFAPRVAAAFSSLASLILIGVTLRAVVRRRREARGAANPSFDSHILVELSALLLALLLVMRITWVHTLTSMLFVWPCLMVPLLRAAERGVPGTARYGLLVCVGFFLSSAHFPVLWGEAFKRWPGSGLAGVHTAGLLLLWWCSMELLRSRWWNDDTQAAGTARTTVSGAARTA